MPFLFAEGTVELCCVQIQPTALSALVNDPMLVLTKTIAVSTYLCHRHRLQANGELQSRLVLCLCLVVFAGLRALVFWLVTFLLDHLCHLIIRFRLSPPFTIRVVPLLPQEWL